MNSRWIAGAVLGAGVGVAALSGSGIAGAAPDVRSPVDTVGPDHAVHPARTGTPSQRSARVASSVTVSLPPVPVREGRSFAVSTGTISTIADRYVTSGGDPADSARFFFGDLAVSSLDALASKGGQPQQVRTDMGNLVVSGYFGGIWLRDNLRGAPASPSSAAPGLNLPAPNPLPPNPLPPNPLSASAIGINLFDAVASGITAAAVSPAPWIATAAAHASVPVLLALYGYNRGYLDVLLDNPPPGVASMRDTLQCNGFLDCHSTAFPLQTAGRYDAGLSQLASPTTLGWLEMAAWSTALQAATGAGRFVWSAIAAAGTFSPSSYAALVDLSSAYLMVTKTAVLAAMTAAADGDVETARSALLLEAGLFLWSGSYFAGLASDAPRGTLPAVTING